MRKGLKSVNFYIDEDLLEKGKELAFLRKLNFSAFLRELVKEEIEKIEYNKGLQAMRELERMQT